MDCGTAEKIFAKARRYRLLKKLRRRCHLRRREWKKPSARALKAFVSCDLVTRA